MIHTNRIVTVGEQESIIDRPIVLYRGDREVEIEFTLVGNEFTFSEEGNVIKSVNASHGQLVLNTPSGEHMFSELAECHEGKVVFVVTKEMIDEFIEMGFYSFQIRLYDSAEMKSRVTIPPVMNGFDIRNPIAAEDEANVVDQGIVGYARIFKDQSNEELPTFDWQGNYNKTEWVHHDVITENKLNKIEDALYSINVNVKESDMVMINTLDQVKKDADKYVKEHMAEVEADVDEFERNLNTDVQKFKTDTNATVTAYKNEVSEELESVNSQLAHITSKYINCSELGMTTSDNGVNNYSLLCNAIDKGYRILVDDMYPLSIASHPVSLDIYIEGQNQNCGFNIIGGSASGVFVLKGNNQNVHINNVWFDSKTKVSAIISQSNVNIKVNDITISNCKFTNSMRALNFTGDITINPEEVDYGINTFTFKGNTVEDMVVSCVILNDIPHKFIEVRDNYIHNFYYVFFSCAVANEHSYNPQMLSAKGMARIENNKVVNDNNWYNGTSAGLYHAFVVIECTDIVYEHNHVEGLKDKTTDRAVYDAYLSAHNVVYQYNVWKNNVCFSTTKKSHALMKAKGGAGELGGKRLYNHNRFYMDTDFHEQHGFTIDHVKTKMFDNVSATEWDITNNIIDIPYLSGQSSSSPYYRVNISNNKIKTTKWDSSNLICVSDKLDVTICDNKIDIKNDDTFKMVTSYGQIGDKIVVRGNILNLYRGIFMFYGVGANEIIFENNKVEYTSDLIEGITTRRIFYSTRANTMRFVGNYIKSLGNHTVILGMPLGADLEYDCTGVFRTFNNDGGFNGLQFSLGSEELPTKEPRLYSMDITMLTNGKLYNGKVTFKSYISEEGNRYIEYTNEQGEAIVRNLEETASNWQHLKIEGELPITVSNPSSNITGSLFGVLMLTGNTLTDVHLNIKIKTIKLSSNE